MTNLEKKEKRRENEEKRINYIGVLIGIIIYGGLTLYIMIKNK